MNYPDGWIHLPQEGGVIFASDDFLSSNGDEGAGVIVLASPLDDLGVYTLDDMWDKIAGSITGVPRPRSITLGGEDALTAEIEESGTHLLLTVTIANDYGYAFMMLTKDWDTYEPIFNAMLDSVEFFPPK
jgi:hypothetical protein